MVRRLHYKESLEHSADVLLVAHDNKEEVWDLVKDAQNVSRKWFDLEYELSIGKYAVVGPDDCLSVLPEYAIEMIFEEETQCLN